MEELIVLLLPAIFAIAAVRVMLLPLGFLFKLGIHSGCGLVCLWLLNSISAFTGICFPIHAATVLIAGFLGLPGIAIMALLAVV